VGARKWNEYNWQEQQTRDFHTCVALWCVVQKGPNLQLRWPPLRGGHIPSLKKIPSAIPKIQAIKLLKKKKFFFPFHTLCKNCYNSRMQSSIWLKFDTHIGGLKANTIIKFEVNLINFQGVISNLTHKAKSNFCHAYRINHFEGTSWKSICS